MASRIKGITIELGMDATPLQKALGGVDKSLRNTQTALKDVNKLLKLDPTNVELLKQKQELLKSSIDDTKKRLETLRDAYKQLDAQGTEEAKQQQQALAREIADTEQKLESLEGEYVNFGSVAGQVLQAVGGKMKEFGEKVTDMGQEMSMKVTAPLVALGGIGISYNAQVEQARTMFTTLTGSAEEADRIISQLQADAQKSPFDSSSLIKANQYLISAGVNADDARTMINNLGEAVAATGGGSSELERMAQNLQQIQNTGKATSQDIKQFANAGINIYGLLAEATGKTTEEVKDMDVTYEELSRAFALASEEGGKFHGAMEAQSQTLTGSLSSTKESIQMLLGSITESAMPIIVDVLNKVKEIIDKLMGLDDKQKQLILTIGAIVAVIGPALVMIGTIITTIGSITSGVGFLIGKISLLWGWLSGTLFPWVTGTLIPWISGTLVPILTNPVVLAIMTVIAVGVALYKNWDTIKQKGGELLEKIKTVFSDIKSSISEKMNSAKEAVKKAIDKIKGFFNFSWSLPKLSLPHISITGGWSLKPPSAPHFSISWYAKAMKDGMILNNPTIFGMMDGKLLGAGEAGSETIIGTNSLMNMIREASQGTTINMTVNGSNVSANELADIVADKLTKRIARNNMRWR